MLIAMSGILLSDRQESEGMIKFLPMFEVRRNFTTSVVLVFALSTVAPAARAQTASTTDSAAATFKANCAVCHGADGAGTPLGTRLHAPDLRTKETQEKTPAALTQTITAGKNHMPAFGTKLDSQQIQKLVEYIRTFHVATAPPSK
jgi:cytochrome c6